MTKELKEFLEYLTLLIDHPNNYERADDLLDAAIEAEEKDNG